MLVQTLDGLAGVGDRAKDYPEATKFLQEATKRIVGALNGPQADPATSIADLAATLDEAERVQPKLNGAQQSFTQRRPKLPADLKAVGDAMARLAPPMSGPQPSIGGLIADPAALAKATAFERASTCLPTLEKAKGTANQLIAYFRDRTLPEAGVFSGQLREIIARADPLADVGFAAAIQALDDLAVRIADAKALRDENRKKADKFKKLIAEAIGEETVAGKGLLNRLSDIPLGDGDVAAAGFDQLDKLIEGAAANSGALKRVLAEGEKALGSVSLGLPARVALKLKAERAISAQIERPGGDDPALAIQALEEANQFLTTFHDAFQTVSGNIEGASRLHFPPELTGELKQHDAKARDSAAKLDKDLAMSELKKAELLAGVILASSQQFEMLDAIIEHGTAEQKSSLPSKREAGVSLGRTWTGGGKEFAKQFATDIGDLAGEVGTAYQAQRKQRKPDGVVEQYKAIVPVYATLEGTPPPPADPAAMIKSIDELVKQRKLQDAFRKLPADFDPLAKDIKRIHPLLAEITGFQADWAAMKASYLAALPNAHPDQKAELETTKKDAEDQRLTTPAAGRILLAQLPPRITAITNKGAGWKGTVPSSLAASRPANFATSGAATAAAAALLADGGLTHDNIRSLIPVTVGGGAVPNSFGASTKYPQGFKYRWVADDGNQIEIYGHGPSVGTNVDASSISAQGNVVRILVNGRYLQSDGTTKVKSTTDKGHIPLFGNP